MPFSHHSHSGQFCPGHAKDSLEEIIQTAVAKQFKVFALTEHMPRHEQDRYPEESNYFQWAQKLRVRYQDQIQIPIGFEAEWCGPHSLQLIQASLQAHPFDFSMGSIHHVGGIPIDYDKEQYNRARDQFGGSDEKLFEQYFDEQLEMLTALKPPVVGHMDLIRLLSDSPNIDWQELQDVWVKILRNLDFVASYGGLLEINTAAWRKGLAEPYPKSEICQAFLARGGRFCLSDDSHGIDHVATNYHKLIDFLDSNHIKSLSYIDIDKTDKMSGEWLPSQSFGEVSVDSIRAHPLLTGGTFISFNSVT